MSTKQKNVHSKKWDKKDIEKAFLEVDAGNSMRKTAEKYGMSEETLHGSGRSTILSQAAEEQLAKPIGTICSLGFSPTREQIKILFKNMSPTMNLEHPLKMVTPGKIGFEH